ncbi:MAG: zinc ribbon domain-containing protein [Dehalococcoidia bacterium]|nr:zinc ribbon domain-containing protein [Dehalococcoidia bacterium]
MASDDTQQIFLCPNCGAQNVVGQQVCQTCGQKFQYNCPHCGFIVDPTLINCPNCRGVLNWPTPRKVKAFPRQVGRYQEQEEGEEEGEVKPKKKSDPWLTGCLGLVIIAFVVLGGYFLYDTFFQGTMPAVPSPSPVTDNQTRLEPMQPPGFESFRVAGGTVVPGVGALIRDGTLVALVR